MLLQICCAPCAIYPYKELQAAGHEVTGFFFNHNIHPYQEYLKRFDTVREYSRQINLELIIRDEYRLEEFLTAVSKEPALRCTYCYTSRLDAAAKTAAENNFDSYTSTLLYSRYQQHDLIRKIGEELGRQHGIAFHYDDYRRGWQQGIRISKELGLYRQQYCGCIYSEKERYVQQALK